MIGDSVYLAMVRRGQLRPSSLYQISFLPDLTSHIYSMDPFVAVSMAIEDHSLLQLDVRQALY